MYFLDFSKFRQNMAENRFFFFNHKNHFFKKSDLTTNIFMLVNLEPIFGFILEINSILKYLHGHMVVAMCFNMGHLVKKSGKNEADLEVSILT